MAASRKSNRAALTQEIIRLCDTAYNPASLPEDKISAAAHFAQFLNNISTMVLLPILTSLVQPGRVQESARPHLTRALTRLPLRPHGVYNTIEFVLAIHPSTAGIGNAKDSATSQGANISLEALNSASKLISSPPAGMPPQAWFDGIAPQLFALLDGEGGLEMVKAASFIIGYGILGRRDYGAPGTAGWKAFAEPILGSINPSLRASLSQEAMSGDKIIDLSRRNVLIPASQLTDSLRRLASLLSSHPNPNLSKRLLCNLLLPLWSLFSWSAAGTQYEAWRAPAGYLLQAYLQLSDSSKLTNIVDSILFCGRRDSSRLCWSYKSRDHTITVERIDQANLDRKIETREDMAHLDDKIDTFMALLQQTGAKNDETIQTLFFELCKKWLASFAPPSRIEITTTICENENPSNEGQAFIEGKIMQKIMEVMPERLIGRSVQVLELTETVLRAARNRESLTEDDTIGIALSLLNIVFVSSHFRQGDHAPVVDSIRTSLKWVVESGADSSSTARNLLLLLEFQGKDQEARTAEGAADFNEEDRRTYRLAMSYLMTPDSPPPVRAQGLDLLTKLIATNSPILDIPRILVLLSSLLQDEEEYIYFRSIKAHMTLSVKHPKTVMHGLVDNYIDSTEELSVDARLRVGETLLQVIERAGQAFTGSIAKLIGDALLETAGRRGIRPRLQERQMKEATLSKTKAREFMEAWDGIDPDAEVEPANEIMTQIVDGWEGKGGGEDVRIRTSSLAIFGSAIEYNIAGMGSSLVGKGIDLSINILALEPEPERAILRRSAVLVIMSLIRALDLAASSPGFGFAGQSLDDVLRILKYIVNTDNDGLVRQHATDVIEGLEIWQMKNLTGHHRTSNISSLAEGPLQGLNLCASGTKRAMIEEIE